MSDDPSGVLASVRDLPPMIGTGDDELYFMLGVYGLLVVAMYLLGRWRFPVRPTPFGPLLIYPVPIGRRLLACGLGAVNGYMIIHSLAPFLLSEGETVIKLPSGQLTSLLDDNLVLVLVGFTLILIVFGLQASGRCRS